MIRSTQATPLEWEGTGLPEAPGAPETLKESGLSVGLLSDLILRTLYTRGSMLGLELARGLCLPFKVVEEPLRFLKDEKCLEIAGGDLIGRISYRFNLTDLGRRGPVLLVVEDVHWADESTRELLTLLFTRGGPEGVGLLATYRSDDVHRRHPLTAALAVWSRLPGLTRVDLGPLALPHHGVKGAEQRPCADAAGGAGLVVQVRRAVPPLDDRGDQLARLDELGDRLRRPGRGHPVVVAQALGGGDTVRPGGPTDQLPVGVGQ